MRTRSGSSMTKPPPACSSRELSAENGNCRRCNRATRSHVTDLVRRSGDSTIKTQRRQEALDPLRAFASLLFNPARSPLAKSLQLEKAQVERRRLVLQQRGGDFS